MHRCVCKPQYKSVSTSGNLTEVFAGEVSMEAISYLFVTTTHTWTEAILSLDSVQISLLKAWECGVRYYTNICGIVDDVSNLNCPYVAAVNELHAASCTVVAMKAAMLALCTVNFDSLTPWPAFELDTFRNLVWLTEYAFSSGHAINDILCNPTHASHHSVSEQLEKQAAGELQGPEKCVAVCYQYTAVYANHKHAPSTMCTCSRSMQSRTLLCIYFRSNMVTLQVDNLF